MLVCLFGVLLLLGFGVCFIVEWVRRMPCGISYIQYIYLCVVYLCYLCYEFRTQLIYIYIWIQTKVKHENDRMIVVPRCMFTFVLFLSSAIVCLLLAADCGVLFEYIYVWSIQRCCSILFQPLYSVLEAEPCIVCKCVHMQTKTEPFPRPSYTHHTFRWYIKRKQKLKTHSHSHSHIYSHSTSFGLVCGIHAVENGNSLNSMRFRCMSQHTQHWYACKLPDKKKEKNKTIIEIENWFTVFCTNLGNSLKIFLFMKNDALHRDKNETDLW